MKIMIGNTAIPLTPVDMSKFKRLEGKELADFNAQYRDVEPEPPRGLPDNHPSKRRADIVIGGHWVATVYEKGSVHVADKYSGVVLAMNNDWLSADEIARKVARAVGGTVTKPRDW